MSTVSSALPVAIVKSAKETDMNKQVQAIRHALDVDLPDVGIKHVIILGEVATGKTTVAERIAAALPDAAGIQLLVSRNEMEDLSKCCGRVTVVPMNSAPPANLVRDAASCSFDTLVVGDTSDENAETMLRAMSLGFHAPRDADAPSLSVIVCHRAVSRGDRPDPFMDRIRAEARGTIAVVRTVMDRDTRVRSIAAVKVL